MNDFLITQLAPLLSKAAEKIIISHGVSKEKYFYWAYKKILRQTIWSGYLIVSIIFILLTSTVFVAVEKNNANLELPLKIFLYSTLGPGLGLLIGLLTMRSLLGRGHISPLTQKMFLNGIQRCCTDAFLKKISGKKWLEIQSFKVALNDKNNQQTILKQPEKLAPAEFQKKQILMQWGSFFSWSGVAFFLLLVFGPEKLQPFATAMLLIGFGGKIFVTGLEGWMIRKITMRQGASAGGIGAKIMGSLLLFLGLFFFSIGFLGLFLNLS